MNIYEACPTLESEKFILRLIHKDVRSDYEEENVLYISFRLLHPSLMKR